ncbi:MAG: C25 family cysteine peptidase [Candidatus Kapabacteria bacterium]|nr:C25 family cysteine peptidase [Candidatus Kapabacteria bacterium]
MKIFVFITFGFLILFNSQAKAHEFGLNNGELDWFDRSKTYIKIETTEDGVTAISFAELINLMPELSGASINHIHMTHQGKPYSRYIIDDNGIIDNNSKLIFYGRRPFGDTTHWDFYASHEPFFLYIDDTKEPQSYNLTDDAAQVTVTEKADFRLHIQKETIYSLGSDFDRYWAGNEASTSVTADSRTIMGEGWYWALLTPSPQRPLASFKTQIGIYATGDASDDIRLFAHYRTIQDTIKNNVPTLSYYDLRLNVNAEFKDRDSLTGYKSGTLVGQMKGNQLSFGLNEIAFEYHQVYNTTNSPVGLQYFILEGTLKTLAAKGKSEFFVKNPSTVRVSGYHSNEIIALDTAEKTIRFGKNQKQGFVYGGGAQISKFTSLVLNDSKFYNTKNGIHVLYRKPGDTEAVYLFDPAFSSTLNGVLSQLPNGTELVAVVNSPNELQGNRDEFAKLGAKNVKNINAGDIWTFAVVKGEANSVQELKQTQNVNFSGFIESNNGIRYQADLNVNTNRSVNMLTHDLNSVQNTQIRKITFKNLASSERSANAIYLTHKLFTPEVERLAEFRKQTQGFEIEIVDIFDVYNEFNFGKQSPYAIKKFLKHAYDNWQSPQIRYLMIAGDATWDPRMNYVDAVSKMFVPSWGNPSSDWWYGCLDGEDDYVPEILVGRVTANSLTEMRDYVDKAIVYDTIPPNRWMKNVLFLTGGDSANERRQFFERIWIYYEDKILSDGFCGHINYVRKLDDAPSSGFQGGEIRNEINKGAFWTIFIGHASAQVFDLDGWAASNLNNKDRYGILTTISCNSGAFSEPRLIYSRNEQYLMQKEKGFVSVLGSSTLGFVDEHNNISHNMLGILSDINKRERNLAEILQFGKSKMAPQVLTQLWTLYQFTMLGDPLIRVRLGTDPDLYLLKSDIRINSEINPNISDKEETVSITGSLNNYGIKALSNFKLLLIRTFKGESDTLSFQYTGLCSSEEFSFDLPVKSMSGTHTITLIADPDDRTNDIDRSNNQISFSVEVFGNQLLPVEPLAMWDVNSDTPKFRFIEPLNGTFDYEFQVVNPDNGHILDYSTTKEQSDNIIISETHIDYTPNTSLTTGALYLLKSKRIEQSINDNGFVILPFVASDLSSNNQANWTLPFNDKLQFDDLENLAVKNNHISINDSLIPVKIISVKGVDDPENNRFFEPYLMMQVGDKVTADGPYELGISVTVINSKTFPDNIVHRRFDTWGLHVNNSTWRTDSTSFRLVEFLRDSISENDFVMIGSSRSAFRLPVFYKVHEENPGYGSIDTLLAEFKKLGSLIGDTLDINLDNMGYDISFAMLGWRGATVGSIPEGINMFGDSVIVEGFITKFQHNGKMTSPIIGPAQKWNNINFTGNLENTTADINIKVYGLTKENAPTLLISSAMKQTIDISSINASEYSHIYFETEFVAKDISIQQNLSSAQTNLTSVLVNYLPTAELAIIQSETKPDKEHYVIGDEAKLNIAVRNLSFRASAENVDTEIIVRKGGSETITYDYKIESIGANEKIVTSMLIDTRDLDSLNTIFINLDKDTKLNELYSFNNSATTSLSVGPDTEKPHVRLKFDGLDFVDGNYISRQPVVEVFLYDNSKLSFNDPELVSVRLNGFLHPYQRTIWHEFEPISDGTDLKAIFRFMPDTLQYADASIIVYFSDLEGNADTLELSAKVMLNNTNIGIPNVVPNPATELTQIEFMYAAPEGGANGVITVFDLHGRNVRTIEKSLAVGLNKIQFDLRDNYGSILPTGVYFFVVNAEGNYYHEPQRGKLVIVR